MNPRVSLRSLAAILSPSLGYVAEQWPQEAQLGLASSYLEARAATMQATAGPADVERALAFCTASLVYEHPRAGVTRRGVDTFRAGMLSFLGSSRNASITITASLQGRDMVAAQTDVTFEALDGDTWVRVSRSQTWLFEFEGSKIKRIIEYW